MKIIKQAQLGKELVGILQWPADPALNPHSSFIFEIPYEFS
jgi:hypothetical protein